MVKDGVIKVIAGTVMVKAMAVMMEVMVMEAMITMEVDMVVMADTIIPAMEIMVNTTATTQHKEIIVNFLFGEWSVLG